MIKVDKSKPCKVHNLKQPCVECRKLVAKALKALS